MEIEKTGTTSEPRSRRLREGDVVRVRVLGKNSRGGFLVELRGRVLSAHLEGKISSSLFLARVMKTTPRVELRLLRPLDDSNPGVKMEGLQRIIQDKKELIQNLFGTDKFFETRGLHQQLGAKTIRKGLERSVRNQNLSNIMREPEGVSQRIVEYYVLQNLANLVRANSLLFLFPLTLDRKRLLCDLQLYGGKDAISRSVFLSLAYEDGRRIGFLVTVDPEELACSVSANDGDLERVLVDNREALLEHLRAVDRRRKVTVDYVPHDDHMSFVSAMVKKIDLKM